MNSGASEDMDDVIGDIYEAALFPDHWPKTLEGIARQAASAGGIMLVLADRTGQWLCNEAGRDLMARFVSEGWIDRNERARRTLLLNEPRFVSDLDIFTIEEIEHEPIYRDFLRPSGLGWGAGTIIRAVADDMIAVTVERSHAAGPLTQDELRRLDRLRPHLARSALLASRLKLERAESAVDVLAALRLPAAILSQRGKIVALNDDFAALVPDVVTDVAGRIGFVSKQAAKIMRDFLKIGALHPDAANGISFPLETTDEKRAVRIVHLVPLVRECRDLFSAANWVVFMTGLQPNNAVRVGLLEGLFDLTPAEARVARAVLGGETVNEIAASTSVATETVRSQLKSVFRKTGTRGQVDLVRLLTGAG